MSKHTDKPKMPRTYSAEKLDGLTLIEAMHYARDIHAAYAARRRGKDSRAWDAAWTLIYDQVIEKLGR